MRCGVFSSVLLSFILHRLGKINVKMLTDAAEIPKHVRNLFLQMLELFWILFDVVRAVGVQPHENFSQLSRFHCESHRQIFGVLSFAPAPGIRKILYVLFDLSQLKPTVAFPHLPENTKTIDEISEDVKIDQSVIGSCTNGRMDDLRAAAEILKGRRVKKGVRCIVIPATQAIYLQAMEEGLLKIFIEAGAVVSTPTCGPCLGGYMGILAAGERCISTTNRNFVGRMGHVDSEVYLASPAVAAASAVTGKISSPEELEA